MEWIPQVTSKSYLPLEVKPNWPKKVPPLEVKPPFPHNLILLQPGEFQETSFKHPTAPKAFPGKANGPPVLRILPIPLGK